MDTNAAITTRVPMLLEVTGNAEEAAEAAQIFAESEYESCRFVVLNATLDQDTLDLWRLTIKGAAQYNGHPQALMQLMRVSDAPNLQQLAFAYPEAVMAFLEARDQDRRDGFADRQG